MADPQSNDAFPEDDDEGGSESTVSMASPTIDAAVPLPISVPPPPMAGGPINNMSIPTAPTPFTPGSPPAFPQQGPRPGPNFAANAPNTPKPLPAAGAPAMAGATGAVGGVPVGMKRPQTVIGLAPPPIGAPRPGQAGARVALPSGGKPAPAAVSAPRPAAGAPMDKVPPSSGRGVRPPASSQKPLTPKNNDADSTDEQLAMPGDDMPDSHKEDQATMAKSPEESLALFGLDSGLTDAARAAVVPGRPGGPSPAAGAPPRSPLASTKLGENKGPPMLPPQINIPAPPPMIGGPPELNATTPLPVLHDRSEEEESTRAVSREEMLRGHDAVIIGDEEGAVGEDATLAVAPGYNEAAKNQHLANLAQGSPLGGPAPSMQDQGFPQTQQLPPQQQWNQQPQQGYPQQQQPPQQQWQDPNGAPQQQWQQPHDPNAGYHQQQQPPAQSWTPNPPQSYPGMQVGPVSGPHMPAAYSQVPQSQPHLQVPQSGHMMANQPNAPTQQQGQGPIPYPGNPMMHQHAAPNPFGDWNANAPQPKKPFKVSGQILLLGIVGVVCLAIFVTGIILFATTKF